MRPIPLSPKWGETTGSGSKKLHLFAISADFLFSLFFSPFLSILVLLHGVESLEYPPVCVRRRGKMMSRCPTFGRVAGGYLLLAILILSNTGCLVVAAAGAAGGAAAGYVYVKGKVCEVYNAGLNDTWAATHTALAELGMPILKEDIKPDESFIESRTTDGQQVRIYVTEVDSKIPAEGKNTPRSVRVTTSAITGSAPASWTRWRVTCCLRTGSRLNQALRLPLLRLSSKPGERTRRPWPRRSRKVHQCRPPHRRLYLLILEQPAEYHPDSVRFFSRSLFLPLFIVSRQSYTLFHACTWRPCLPRLSGASARGGHRLREVRKKRTAQRQDTSSLILWAASILGWCNIWELWEGP